MLTAAHPSGLSANRGFFGCRHFSQANALLQKGGQLPIDWCGAWAGLQGCHRGPVPGSGML